MDTTTAVVYPNTFTLPSGDKVYVGINSLQAQPPFDFLGIPLADAAFDPDDPNTVFVVPVVVEPHDYDPYQLEGRYRAGAKLSLTGAGSYTVDEIYGLDPNDYDPPLNAWPPSVAEDKLHWLHEIEVDSKGNVYILSAHDSGDNDWVLIYPEGDGQNETRVNVSDTVAGPTAMLVSLAGSDSLYLASAVTEDPNAATCIWKYTIERSGDTATGLASPQTITIARPGDGSIAPTDLARLTALVEDPNGVLYALGFAMPRLCGFSGDVYTCAVAENDPIFTVPTLATILPGETAVTAVHLTCPGLAPAPAWLISLAFVGVPNVPGDIDWDGDVDFDDFTAFGPCLAGPGVTTPPPGCDSDHFARGDLDSDADLDLRDSADFQISFGTEP